MRTEPRFYKIEVNSISGHTCLICHSYYIDDAKRNIGIEYHQVPDPGYYYNRFLSSTKQSTLPQELRVLKQATYIFTGRRTEEKSHIEKKIRSAYENIIDVGFNEITPSKNYQPSF